MLKGLKNFGITFAVSFVILGIVALFACGYVADTVCGIFVGGGKDIDKILSPGETTATDNGSDDRFSREISGESFTWMWVVSDYRPQVFDNYYPSVEGDLKGLKDFGALGAQYRFPEAVNIVLVRGDITSRSFVIMTIPAMTRVETPAGHLTLGKIYALEGVVGLADKVGAMTGLSINEYSVIHSTDLTAIANMIGSIKCTLPVSIFTDGKDYVSDPNRPKPGEETTKDKEETTKAPETTRKVKDTGKPEETTAPLVNELDSADSVQLANKLMPALLYYDYTDGINDEMTILQSFADGVMNNLSGFSDSELQSILAGLDRSFVANNVTGNSVLLSGELIRAYGWFDKIIVTYPGKFVSTRSKDTAYYNPDISEGVAFFYDYR